LMTQFIAPGWSGGEMAGLAHTYNRAAPDPPDINTLYQSGRSVH
jgi:hypothetical protein